MAGNGKHEEARGITLEELLAEKARRVARRNGNRKADEGEIIIMEAENKEKGGNEWNGE
jgi:hypothetical protein